ncbi:hypothetical protein MCAP1_001676 [Malassezia caprae]|uniref:Uncharacterized protein n=1 Tax=Malassezia caprae TaxID=1381934 RepID=A0AAF0IV94_9BASI|nr:hypothetical protein MCAP1_001676 [Malassezia caprae]
MEAAHANAAPRGCHGAWFDAPEASEAPVAWSRQGVVAHGVRDEHGAHVALLGDTGRAVHEAPLARLFPPTRAPALSTDLPTQLGAPTLVRFSPCGYTLLAYFPAETTARLAPEQAAGAVQVPAAALSTLSATPIQRTPSATPSATLAPVPDHGSPVPTLPSAAASPALTPVPSTPQALEAMNTLAIAPPNVIQGDQGVVCLWTRAPPDPVDRWALHQWVPVSYEAPAHGCVHGDVLDALWLGAPRLWKMEGPTFVREPACGPSTFLPRAALSLDEAQSEQACVLVTRAGQVVFLHRLSSARAAWNAFRVHYGTLSLASIMPPPPTLDAEQAPDLHAPPIAVRHARLCDVPDEPVVLIAYEPVSCAPASAALGFTELQIRLDGEMSYCVVNPLPSVPVDGDSAATTQRTTIEWVRGASALSLWLCRAQLADPSATRSERTCVTEWVAQRAAASASDELRALWDSKPSDATDSTRGRWTLRVAATSETVPHRDAVWATAWDASIGAEVWGTLDARAGTFSRLSDSMPSSWLTRTAWALSPNGVLACTHLWPGGHLVCAPLPVAIRAPSDAGHLFALSLLRHTAHTDVAHAVRAAGVGTYSHLVHSMQATAKALQWGRDSGHQGLTLPQTLHLIPVTLSLVSGATEEAQRRLHDRLALFAAWADMHRALCAARTDYNNTRLTWLATEAHPAVAFEPAHTWALAQALRRAIAWLEQSASVSVQCQVPGARATDVPSDSLLELLAHTGACHLVHEVLAGYLVLAKWLEQVTPAAWAARALSDARSPTAAQHAAAVQHHARVRDYVSTMLASTPLDMVRIMEALAQAPYDVDAPRGVLSRALASERR